MKVGTRELGFTVLLGFFVLELTVKLVAYYILLNKRKIILRSIIVTHYIVYNQFLCCQGFLLKNDRLNILLW